uniref:Uncharacterized protein n=1 Tax=candidate division WOR-3 bacterium TaxID=2052148 RepID=A0A7C6A8R6_UNCW3
MWLITTFIAALIVTLLWFVLKKRYKLGLLSLMLWGATIMILIDHLIGYEGGEFLVSKTDGIIKNGTLLGILMLIPVFLVWFVTLLITKIKRWS